MLTRMRVEAMVAFYPAFVQLMRLRHPEAHDDLFARFIDRSIELREWLVIELGEMDVYREKRAGQNLDMMRAHVRELDQFYME